MQDFSLLPHALLSGVIGTMLSFQPVQTACFPASDPIPVYGKQEATQVLGQASAQFKDLDDVYHSLLRSYEISVAQWRQRPGDLAAFRSHLAELRKEITTLCELAEKVERPSTAPVAKGAAKQSTTPAPSGPVRPSQAPSPDEEVQKRRKATEERFPSVPVEDSPEARTLVGVPKSWIKISCVRALEELDKIGSLLQAESLDHDAVGISVRELCTIIYQLGSPPPTVPPVHPKSSKESSSRRG